MKENNVSIGWNSLNAAWTSPKCSLTDLWCGSVGRWCRAFDRWGSVRGSWVAEGTVLLKYQGGSQGTLQHPRETWLRRSKPTPTQHFSFMFEKSFLLLYASPPRWCHLLQALLLPCSWISKMWVTQASFLYNAIQLMDFITVTDKQTSARSLFLFELCRQLTHVHVLAFHCTLSPVSLNQHQLPNCLTVLGCQSLVTASSKIS